MKEQKNAKKFYIWGVVMIAVTMIVNYYNAEVAEGVMSDISCGVVYCTFALIFIFFILGVWCTISNSMNRATEEKREQNIQNTKAAEGTLPNGMVYKVDGVRGRQLEVYKDRCVLRVTVTAGSLITGNYSDGEKTIYYADCVGVQFKESGIQIGYLQLETATGLMNNKGDNFFNENSFTFDESVVTNAKMREIANYVRERISEAKNRNNSTVVSQVSSADELKKYKDLLDSGVITKEEFDAKKKQLLGL